MPYLMDLWWRISRFKSIARSNHTELLKKFRSAPCCTREIPCAVVGDVAVVNIPIASRISECAGYEYAFKVPDIIENHDDSGKSFTIKNLFHHDLLLTGSSRTGITRCEVSPLWTKRGQLTQPPLQA
jgi:hypothetical protein